MALTESKDSLLEFRQVCAGYGKTRVLHDLTFGVERGKVYGIIGPNGSGKTTTFNALVGLIRPTSGSILFDGRDITAMPVHLRCRMGIGRTFQIPKPFSRMSVYENVLAATVFGAGKTERAGRETALEALELTGLAEKREVRSGLLPLLDRKRLEIARAIGTEPKLLLLDEVAAGLTSAEIDYIIQLVQRLKQRGYTIIWIEHIIETMVNATDHLMCMAEGRCAVEGDPAEVMRSREVEMLYLGVETENGTDSES